MPSNRHFHTLAGVFHEGVVLLSRSGRVDFASTRARELLEVSDDDALAAHWPEIAAQYQCALDTPGAATPSGVEASVTSAQGRPLKLRIFALSEEDCEGVLVIVEDPWTLAALERDLRDANRHRALAELYRAEAHEVRVTLNAIHLSLEVLAARLERRAGDASDSLQAERHQAQMARQEAERLTRAMELLLAQSRAEDGSSTVFDAVRVTIDTVALLGPQAARASVNLELEAPTTPVHVYGRPDAIQQALVNVIVNGIEAMAPRGGDLAVRVRRAGDELCVEITDQGSGIDPRDLPHVFDRHFTRKASGNGIGLYVTRLELAAHGGRIEIARSSADGTTFVLCLPVVPPPA